MFVKKNTAENIRVWIGTDAEGNCYRFLYSYRALVGYKSNNGTFVSDKYRHYSTTTSRHISKYLPGGMVIPDSDIQDAAIAAQAPLYNERG